MSVHLLVYCDCQTAAKPQGEALCGLHPPTIQRVQPLHLQLAFFPGGPAQKLHKIEAVSVP